jgi:hypothetical protein
VTLFGDILLPVILLALLVYYERVDTHEPERLQPG